MEQDYCSNIVKIEGDFLTLNYIKGIFEKESIFHHIKNINISSNENENKLEKIKHWGVTEDISNDDVFVNLDFESKYLYLHFDTQKSCPLPVTQELSKKYKNIIIEHTIYSNCGFYVSYFICSGQVLGFIEDFFINT